jgi:hypothetical protein
VLTRIASFGAVEVVIDHDLDPDGAWRRFVASHPQADLAYGGARYTSYRIRAGARPDALPKVRGTPLPIASIAATEGADRVGGMTDHDVVTRWHAGRAQRPDDSMTADLGAPYQVTGAEMLIAGYVTDFPRRLSIATSLDGQAWSQAWEGGTALIAFSAALEDPLNLPLPFSFDARTARYVRFTQTGSDPTYYWSVAELRILGK